ncbi:MAG: hypothetical protein JSR60_16485 [Proteobacteria bacterium]|nr:hypothetical protein [Pseudomonadota bacterium]
MPDWLRSTLAVLAGVVTIGVLHTGTDMALEGSGIFPPPEAPSALDPLYLGTAVVYRNVYNVLGGYLTGRLAPAGPQMHAAVLGLIGLLLNLAGGYVMWSIGAHWYPVTLAILALPATWLGGWLVSRRAV